MDEKDFEELSNEEQITKLNEIKKTIQQNFIDNKQNFEITDITYNKLSDGKVIYEAICKDFETGEEKKLLYVVDDENKIKPYKPIDVAKIKAMQEFNGIEVNENYEKKAQIEKAEIEKLNDNKTKKSLNELIEKEQQKSELENIGNSLGLDSDAIKEYTKIEGNKGLTDDDFKGYSSTDIKGNDKVSSKFTLNQILGMQYQNYKILQDSNGNTFMVGQKSDGEYEIIDPSKYEVLSSSPQMSLASGDGNIRDVKVEVGIRVKGLASESDQCIGIYRDNDKYGTFYARGYNSREQMIGADIESEPYIKSNTSKAQEIVDRRDNNQINDEQRRIDEAKAKNQNNATKIDDVYDRENEDNDSQIAEDYSENEHSHGTPWGDPNANMH